MEILNTIEFNRDRPTVLQIKKTDNLKMFCVALCKDQLLQKHQTKVPSLLLVLKGSVGFALPGEVLIFRELQTYQIPVNVDHEVKGLLDQNIILITQELISPEMQVLDSRSKIKVLVDRFYDRVKADDVLAPLFAHVDWPHHLPIMYNFWSSLVLGDRSYEGNPFQKHITLPLTATHFTRWLELFNKTVDEHFTGTNAEEVKTRASHIAAVFKHRLNLD